MDPEGYGEGSVDGHHSPWGPRWEIYQGARLPGIAKALETGTFLHRGPVEYHGGPFTGNSER